MSETKGSTREAREVVELRAKLEDARNRGGSVCLSHELADRILAALSEGTEPVSEPAKNAWRPTEHGHFCNQDGCKDARHIGGNHGSWVCRNPNHHDAFAPTTTPEPTEETDHASDV